MLIGRPIKILRASLGKEVADVECRDVLSGGCGYFYFYGEAEVDHPMFGMHASHASSTSIEGETGNKSTSMLASMLSDVRRLKPVICAQTCAQKKTEITCHMLTH